MLLAATAIFSSSCTSMLLRYDAAVKLEDGKEVYYTRIKPVDVTSTSIICGITGIYYGGWCWAYLSHPFYSHRSEFIESAQKDLKDKMKNNWYLIGDERIARIGWQESRFESKLYDSDGKEHKVKPKRLSKEKIKAQRIEEKISERIEQRQRILENPSNVMFVYGDLGSFYAPHGSGIGVGYRLESLAFNLGLGLDQNLLGNAFSFEISTDIKPYFISAGMSIYRGSGEQTVILKNDKKETLYEADIDWSYTFAQISFGTYILHDATSHFQLAIDFGAGYTVSSDINLVAEVDDIPDNEEIAGIKVANGDTLGATEFAQQGKGSAFVRLTLIYWLGKTEESNL